MTALAHLLTLLLRDVARQGHTGKVVFGVLVAAALLLPAGFGALAFAQQRTAAICGAPGAANQPVGFLGNLCLRLQ